MAAICSFGNLSAVKDSDSCGCPFVRYSSTVWISPDTSRVDTSFCWSGASLDIFFKVVLDTGFSAPRKVSFASGVRSVAILMCRAMVLGWEPVTPAVSSMKDFLLDCKLQSTLFPFALFIPIAWAVPAFVSG